MMFLCHTGLQNDFHGFLCTCEGGGVHGEMAELVLMAELPPVLYLWQTGE